MIEPTDEMVQTLLDHLFGYDAAPIDDAPREALAAVLAIVERDQAGPCASSLDGIGMCTSTMTRCQLNAGHAGDHRNGDTRWWEV